MEGLTHAPFIFAAYGIAACVLGGLVMWILLQDKKIRAQLEAAQSARPRRRSR